MRVEVALQPLGVTTTQFRILSTLSQGEKRSSAELSRMFGIKPQTMIKQIAILESNGLSERNLAKGNKRVLEVTMTEARLRQGHHGLGSGYFCLRASGLPLQGGRVRARACLGAVSYSLRQARRSWREDEKPARSATRSMSRRVWLSISRANATRRRLL